MGLDKSNIRDEIKSAMNAAVSIQDPDKQSQAIDDWAESIANTIVTAIQEGIDSAQVTLALTSPSGPVTGTITITTQVQD